MDKDRGGNYMLKKGNHMKQEALDKINSAIFDLEEALAAIRANDMSGNENRISEALRKLRNARREIEKIK